MRDRIKEIMAQVFELDISEIPDDASQKNLSQWDSLQHLNLIVELEEAFNLSFEPEQIGEMTSISKIEETIKFLEA